MLFHRQIGNGVGAVPPPTMQQQQYPPPQHQQQYPPAQNQPYPPHQQQQQQPQWQQGPQHHGQQPSYQPPVYGVIVQQTRGPPDWQEKLCGCTEDTDICCEEFWCCYCHLGFMHSYLDTGAKDIHLIAWGALCIDVFFTGGIARCLYLMHVRNTIVGRYYIEEGGCKTCLLATFCGACASCQMHREMHRRGDFTGGLCYKAHYSQQHGAPRMGEQQHAHHKPPQQPPSYSNDQKAHPSNQAQPYRAGNEPIYGNTTV